MAEDGKRKCIGVLISKPDRDYQCDILHGIYKAAFENDMSVAVFGASISSSTDKAIESEMKIFSLPNYELLSGVIYVPMTFDFATIGEKMNRSFLRSVSEKALPAVTIDGIVGSLPCVLCDDTETIHSVLEHLIDGHGCRDIAYMTGPKGHPHADARLKIFIDTMNSRGLEILPERTYHGDFWLNEGDNFVERQCKSPNGLPDAIVCANSYMAFSVYKALRKRGIKVPDDILLADYSDEAGQFDFITGSLKRADAAGYTACKMLAGMINGRQPEQTTVNISCGSKVNRSVTCGCVSAADYDFSAAETSGFNDAESYFGEFNAISTDLLSRPSYLEMFYAINWYTHFVKDMDGLYFCLCDGWNDPAASAGDEVADGFTDRMHIYFSRVNHDDGSHTAVYDGDDHFSVREMFPKMLDRTQPPSSYIFRSLHFDERIFGYIVIDNGNKMRTYNHVFDYWMRDVSNAIESQRRLQNMKYLYNSDVMTGVYNRNGFYQMVPEMCSRAISEKTQFFTAVFDLNGMKYINDTFGHNEGDNAIKTAASIISGSRLKGASDERNFRIGGDEFVKAAVGTFAREDINELVNAVEHKAEEYNASSGKPYPVYISAGTCVKNCDEEFTLDSMIHEADEEMFRKKAELRQKTGFFPERRKNR